MIVLGNSGKVSEGRDGRETGEVTVCGRHLGEDEASDREIFIEAVPQDRCLVTKTVRAPARVILDFLPRAAVLESRTTIVITWAKQIWIIRAHIHWSSTSAMSDPGGTNR
jgi:hypothetical protein